MLRARSDRIGNVPPIPQHHQMLFCTIGVGGCISDLLAGHADIAHESKSTFHNPIDD